MASKKHKKASKSKINLKPKIFSRSDLFYFNTIMTEIWEFR
jgi:hypothetical protein